MKSLTISVPDAFATELIAYKSVPQLKELLTKVLADLLREARTKSAEAAKPAVLPVDEAGISFSII
jgi:hypothetical protein